MLKPEIVDLLEIVAGAISLVKNRYAEIEKSGTLDLSPRIIVLLDAISMRLLLIGEKIKSIEQKAPGLLAEYGIDARPIIRTRDFLSHHYEDVDYDAIMLICTTNLPDLETKINFILKTI